MRLHYGDGDDGQTIRMRVDKQRHVRWQTRVYKASSPSSLLPIFLLVITHQLQIHSHLLRESRSFLFRFLNTHDLYVLIFRSFKTVQSLLTQISQSSNSTIQDEVHSGYPFRRDGLPGQCRFHGYESKHRH